MGNRAGHMAGMMPAKGDDDMSKSESAVPVAYPVGTHAGMPVALGIPVSSAPPTYAVATSAMDEEPLPVGATRHPWQGPEMSYDSGILRAIAIKLDGGWRNPYTNDQVAVKYSGMANGYAEMIVDRLEPKYFQTADAPNSWVEIDLGMKRTARPTAYTMCTFEGANRKTAPLSWVLEAAVGGKDEWQVLSQHVNDTTLSTAPKKPATWMIAASPQYFRRFRVRMTGPSGDGKHSLGVSCIEFHGDLMEEGAQV